MEENKKMLPHEFIFYLKKHTPSIIRYCSEKQEWFDNFGIIPTFDMSFQNVMGSINPTYIIVFNSLPGHWIRFDGIKAVNVIESVDGKRAEFQITCYSPLGEPRERTYSLTAEYTE